MAIAGLQAGKHVYVEKPCSHNPGEGALLVRAQQKYGKLVQMGTQQRSSPHTIEIVEKIRPRPSDIVIDKRRQNAFYESVLVKRSWRNTLDEHIAILDRISTPSPVQPL